MFSPQTANGRRHAHRGPRRRRGGTGEARKRGCARGRAGDRNKSSEIMPRKSIAPPIGLANPFARSLARPCKNAKLAEHPFSLAREPQPLPKSSSLASMRRGETRGRRSRSRKRRKGASMHPIHIPLKGGARGDFSNSSVVTPSACKRRQTAAAQRGGMGRREGRERRGVPCLLCKSNRF